MTEEYQVDSKGLAEAFKPIQEKLFREWICPEHGGRCICEHYNNEIIRLHHELQKQFIRKISNSCMPNSIKPSGIDARKPIGYYIRTFNAKAPDGYEYAWKTFYKRIDDTLILHGGPMAASLKEGYEPVRTHVGTIDNHNRCDIPRNADGFFADDVAVLCIRKIQSEEPRLDIFRPLRPGEEEELPARLYGKQFESGYAPVAQIKPEGCPIADGTHELGKVAYTDSPLTHMTNGQYNGCDKQHWANIMESMDTNLAKADEATKLQEALEATDQQILKDAVGFIMEHNRHGHFNDAAEEEADSFSEKYRAHLLDMGYRRF